MPGDDPTTTARCLDSAHHVSTFDMHDLQGGPFIATADKEPAIEAEAYALDGPDAGRNRTLAHPVICVVKRYQRVRASNGKVSAVGRQG